MLIDNLQQHYYFITFLKQYSKELIKVIRKLGIMNPEPHFNILMKAGKARPTDKRISYTEFSSNLLAEINKR